MLIDFDDESQVLRRFGDYRLSIRQIGREHRVQFFGEVHLIIITSVSVSKRMNAEEKRRQILREAWVGDAVLSLYARQRILRETSRLDSERFERMTSNKFLSSRGEPSEVEAEIGRVYETQGLESAFAWVERELMPLFTVQEQKRLRAAGKRASAKK